MLNAPQSAEFLKADQCCAFYVSLISQFGIKESRVCFSNFSDEVQAGFFSLPEAPSHVLLHPVSKKTNPLLSKEFVKVAFELILDAKAV